MTFKHMKFEDSPTMRALEKVAKEKGLVKSDPLQKSAAVTKKADYTPSSDLMENILKLCAGLRTQGLVKEAVEIETNFFNYKQAQTLYETSKETGDDLIQSAHPKGSHKLEGIEGEEATVEDILDQHTKILEKVNKTPNGKLESTAQLLDAVKTVLGGESFLARRGKVSLAQEATKPPTQSGSGSGIATDLAGTAGFMGGIAGLKWLYTKLKASPSTDAKIIKDIETQMARNLTKAEADAVSKQVIDRVGAESMKKILGENTAKAVTEKVTETAIKNVATQAATKSPGVWSRLLSFVTKPIGGGGAVAGTEAAAVGGVEAAGAGVAETAAVGLGGEILAGSVAAIGATVGAVLVGAIGGGLIGNALFEHYYKVTDLKEAGDRVLSEAKDVESDFLPNEYAFVTKFARDLGQITQMYSVVEKLKAGGTPTPADLKSMKDVNDLIYQSRKDVGAVWSYAMGHKDDQILGFMRGFGDVVSAAANYMDVAQKINAAFDSFAQEAAAVVEQKLQKQVSSKGGASVVDLQNGYTAVLADIERQRQIIQAKRLVSAKSLTDWLDKIKGIVDSESTKFKAVPEANKPTIAQYYADRLNKIKPKLKALSDKLEKLT